MVALLAGFALATSPLRLEMEIERIEYPNSPDRASTVRRLEAEITSVAQTQNWSKDRAAKELEREIARLPKLPQTVRSFATLHQDGARLLFREYEVVDGKRSKTPTRLTLYDGRESYVIAGGELLMRWRTNPLGGLRDLPNISPGIGSPLASDDGWSHDAYARIGETTIPTKVRFQELTGQPRKPWKEVRYRILPSQPPSTTDADFGIHHHAKGVKYVDMGEGICTLGSVYLYDPQRGTFEGLRKAD